MNTKLKLHIRTFGCQMNFYDSDVALGALENAGFEIIKETAHPYEDSDVFILNTCSVREHAETRVYGHLYELRDFKAEKKPDLIVGLMGCMAEEHKEKLFKKFPHLDFLCGTRNIKELPEIVETVRKTRQQTARIKKEGLGIEYSELTKYGNGINAWLPIMTGCNKVCTYCIVPTTRGPEVSMPAREVYKEASRLAEQGYKQITLLGQNVNSYGKDLPGNPSFPELLRMLDEIEGLELISFTTSHPEDATEELFLAMRDSKKVSRRFHLPLQSGSDAVLKRMKRLHRYAEFKAKVDRFRELVPDISLTTDIIVGFCGETEEDFEATKRAIKEIEFDGAYIFQYSPRPATPAYKIKDDVPKEVKNRRNVELLAIQDAITKKHYEKLIGSSAEVLVDHISRKDEHQMIGQTRHERHVVFGGTSQLSGTTQTIQIKSVRNKTLLGELVSAAQ